MTPLFRATALVISTLWLGSVVAGSISDDTQISLSTAITVFGAAFGAWAFLLGYVIFVVRKEFSELRHFVREESERRRESDDRAHQDRLHLEQRLTQIETYWRHVSNNHG